MFEGLKKYMMELKQEKKETKEKLRQRLSDVKPVEKQGYLVYEAGNLEGDDQGELSLLNSFVLFVVNLFCQINCPIAKW